MPTKFDFNQQTAGINMMIISGVMEISRNLRNRKKELVCKPGSVKNSHSSRLQVTLQLKQSTQEPRGPRVCSPI